jgi:hypothetical protein
MWRFANAAHRGGYAPRTKDGVVSPEDLLIRIQAGAEVGMTPMQSIQNIASIKGRPCIWGDAMLGLCLASPHFSHNDFKEWYTGTPYEDDYTAHCQVRRREQVERHVSSFSVAMAKKAKLWGKEGPWQTFPDRMLAMRARTFACRDRFADVLKGLSVAEEVNDIEAAISGVDLEKTSDQLRAEMAKPAPEPPPAPEPETTTGKAKASPKKTNTAYKLPTVAEIRAHIETKFKALPMDAQQALLKELDKPNLKAVFTDGDAGHLQSILDMVISASVGKGV